LQDTLWQHHELFQDAVNYYLLALLSLCARSRQPATSIRKRMTTRHPNTKSGLSFRSRGQTRRGYARIQYANYLCPGKTEPTLETCFAAVLDGNKENSEVLDLALQELLERMRW